MAALNVLIVPSRSEGTPLVTLEAMSVGVPVVAAAVGGIPDQIVHGESGLLAPPEDSHALASAALLLFRDPALVRRVAQRGRMRAATTLNHSTMVARVEAVYRQALEGRASLDREMVGGCTR